MDRNAKRLTGKSDDPVRSDALVLFGATGDLAHKMIFPALYAMAKRGRVTRATRDRLPDEVLAWLAQAGRDRR
jgi:TfoX/Sxy family transcriptional regulator of competence genes